MLKICIFDNVIDRTFSLIQLQELSCEKNTGNQDKLEQGEVCLTYSCTYVGDNVKVRSRIILENLNN